MTPERLAEIKAVYNNTTDTLGLIAEIERLHTELVKRENRIAVLFRRITKLETE